jgi:cyclohexa-1,5-dienecarbonyl-CoA hydratase
METAASSPVAVETLEDGAVWRVTLGGSKGNIVDAAACADLGRVFADAARASALKAVLFEGQGKHFSFGASVQEHLPGEAAGMLARFHGLARAIVDSAVTVIAVVRGQCLGGGLELVTLAQRIVAAPDARLGQPEIALGVFAPLASVVLQERVGRRHAEDLLLTGRSVEAQEALAIGLVDEVHDDPGTAALDWVRRHLLPRSASSLRFAVRAARVDLRARLLADLPAVERLYLDELMATRDAVEGLQAFLDKRPPRWSDA